MYFIHLVNSLCGTYAAIYHAQGTQYGLYIGTIQKRNLEFKIPRLQRVLNRSDLRSKLGRIEYTKIHYGTGTHNFFGFGGFGYGV